MISDEEMAKAIDRLARTDDGLLLYRYFQRVLCSVSTSPNDGALREHNGRRSFAAELMGHMAKGIRESGRPTDPALTFAVAGSRRVAPSGGAGRRVTLDTAVPGYDAPAGE